MANFGCGRSSRQVESAVSRRSPPLTAADFRLLAKSQSQLRPTRRNQSRGFLIWLTSCRCSRRCVSDRNNLSLSLLSTGSRNPCSWGIPKASQSTMYCLRASRAGRSKRNTTDSAFPHDTHCTVPCSRVSGAVIVSVSSLNSIFDPPVGSSTMPQPSIVFGLEVEQIGNLFVPTVELMDAD